MHGDLLYVTVVYVNVVMYCMHHSMASLPLVQKWVPPSQPLIIIFFLNAPACIGFLLL